VATGNVVKIVLLVKAFDISYDGFQAVQTNALKTRGF
jgi:hypothetical protein